jgi:PAS domain-containing protein
MPLSLPGMANHMNKNLSDRSKVEFELRAAAEVKLSLAPPTDASAFDAKNLLYELQIHQIELEMQGEQLQQALAELEQSRDYVADLYELAPIAYINLTPDGLISKINLAGAAMLGETRMNLLATRFSIFVSEPQRDKWGTQFSHLVQAGGRAQFDLSLSLRNRRKVYVHLDGRMQQTFPDGMEVHLTLLDVSERHHAEAVVGQFAETNNIGLAP